MTDERDHVNVSQPIWTILPLGQIVRLLRTARENFAKCDNIVKGAKTMQHVICIFDHIRVKLLHLVVLPILSQIWHPGV